MKRGLFFLFIIPGLSFFACNAKEDKRADPEAIYFDYKITAEEGNDNLTILLQFRDQDEEGDAIAMGEVKLDGERVPPDSTRMTGTFYELHKPVAAFTGKHSIIFTAIDKKEYKEEFHFQPVVLLTPLPDTIYRDDLVLEFGGLETEDHIRVLVTDTSFYSNGINQVDTVLNGRLSIHKVDFEALAPGPVQLEFVREYERPVKNGTKEGGRLLITYSIKRESTLRD